METSAVPSSRAARLFHFASLATTIGAGALSEGIRRLSHKKEVSLYSLILTKDNIDRMVKKLSQMRGAVLKLGQLFSFQQDDGQHVFLPKELQEVLVKVQNSANFMPADQLEITMSQGLSSVTWKQDLFSSFEDYPIAAASIGQVHGAVLLENYQTVAIKVQYPGVATSIDSDLNNLEFFLRPFAKRNHNQAFLEKTIETARTELKWECDYLREAQAMDRFSELLAHDSAFVVPEVIHTASSSKVLTMERMWGTELVRLVDSKRLTQDKLNWIATNIMRLCLQEIAVFRYIQTDPNWANYLYNEKTDKIELLDFGASRGYSDKFIDSYLDLLRSAVRGDRESILKISKELGYMSHEEPESVIEAHISIIELLASPFSGKSDQLYDFKAHGPSIAQKLTHNMSVILREGKSAPPEETFGLHRKLSGIYMLCAKLGAKIPSSKLFSEIVKM